MTNETIIVFMIGCVFGFIAGELEKYLRNRNK